MLSFFHSLNPYLATFLVSMMPVGELNASIPMAVGYYHLSLAEALLFSILGGILVATILIYFFEYFNAWITGKNKTIDMVLEKIFSRTRKNFIHDHHAWGDLALVFFIAIPGPFTGVWTGALAAWLFGMPKFHSLLSLIVGTIIAGFIIALITQGWISFF